MSTKKRGRPPAVPDAAAAEKPQEDKRRRKGLITGGKAEQLIPLMHGFGDDPAPLKETAELLEELCVDYIVDLCSAAMDSAGPGNLVTPHDFLFCLRKDREKYARAVLLLERQPEIKEAQNTGRSKADGKNLEQLAKLT